MSYGSDAVLGLAELETRTGRKAPKDDLALYVENPDGTERRIAGDEIGLPLSDYTLASTLPGGFSTLDGDALLPSTGIAPFGKLAAVTARLGDRTVVWEGRTESSPERSEERLLRLACVGHQAALTDAQGIVFLGVLSDLSQWTEPPSEYMEDAATGGSPVSVNGAFQGESSEGGLSIRMTPDRNVVAAARGELWLRAPGTEQFAEAQYIASEQLSASMDSTIRTHDDDFSSLDSDNITANLTVQRWSDPTPGRYLVIRDSPSGTVNKAARILNVYALSAFGNHDLPRAAIEGLPDGLYFSDILGYLVGLHAPILRTQIAGESTIEQSSFPLPNASWLESTGLDQIIEDGVQYEPGKEWAVWENRTLHYATRSSMGREWTVRRSEGARFVDSGETSEPDYNLVVISFTDADGIPRRAGPPGGGYDFEDSSLRDSNPDNPVNASSVVSDRPRVVDLGDCRSDKAIEIGQLALAEAIRRRFAGEVELPRYAEREGEILPTSMIRAGDKIVDADSGETLPLVGATYTRSRGDRPFQGTIDTPSNRLDSAIARMEARPKRVNTKKIRNRRRKRRQSSG